MLTVQGVRKSFGPVEALRGVDLVIRPGEVVGLLGPNGAGKTTLVSVVAGLLRPDAGAVSVGGIDMLGDPRRARGQLGVAPQDTGVYPGLTVHENLLLFGELAGLRGQRLRTAIAETAEAMLLVDVLSRKPKTLSGGVKRRLHTAIALLGRPPVLLLDEPTVGADIQTRSQLISTIRDVAAEGTAVLYSTHYLNEIEELSAAVVILVEGRVVATGGAAELVNASASAIVELSFATGIPTGVLERLAEVETIVTSESDLVRISSTNPSETAARVLVRLGEDGQRLTGLRVLEPTLEDVVLALTRS